MYWFEFGVVEYVWCNINCFVFNFVGLVVIVLNVINNGVNIFMSYGDGFVIVKGFDGSKEF